MKTTTGLSILFNNSTYKAFVVHKEDKLEGIHKEPDEILCYNNSSLFMIRFNPINYIRPEFIDTGYMTSISTSQYPELKECIRDPYKNEALKIYRILANQ